MWFDQCGSAGTGEGEVYAEEGGMGGESGSIKDGTSALVEAWWTFVALQWAVGKVPQKSGVKA
ncbi:hypothetical protein RvY_12623 [Ramazzottius varieornatus]|uniref:Uncharacterized protein n=1 Tax=Ramazzottius varieornatus TaxID=947166 RepID=A0A1D1VK44_RAMVA|nr:hypothetical protein RvY_12623 [Ramazzottius varieornatus]